MSLNRTVGWLFVTSAIAICPGCSLRSAHTYSRDYSQSASRIVGAQDSQGSFEDCVEGGELFKIYCGSCHNARPLAERNFRETEVSFSHMKTQAYLTGEEYRKLIHYLRRWHDLGPPVSDEEPSPKRFFFSQPIAELSPERNSPESQN
ncbi:MAG: hypothetical protein KDB03_17025 [Planctomycetales bacterium]|nr:hypothetical protein [Planctomycetales bacterium]